MGVAVTCERVSPASVAHRSAPRRPHLTPWEGGAGLILAPWAGVPGGASPPACPVLEGRAQSCPRALALWGVCVCVGGPLRLRSASAHPPTRDPPFAVGSHSPLCRPLAGAWNGVVGFEPPGRGASCGRAHLPSLVPLPARPHCCRRPPGLVQGHCDPSQAPPRGDQLRNQRPGARGWGWVTVGSPLILSLELRCVCRGRLWAVCVPLPCLPWRPRESFHLLGSPPKWPKRLGAGPI